MCLCIIGLWTGMWCHGSVDFMIARLINLLLVCPYLFAMPALGYGRFKTCYRPVHTSIHFFNMTAFLGLHMIILPAHINENGLYLLHSYVWWEINSSAQTRSWDTQNVLACTSVHTAYICFRPSMKHNVPAYKPTVSLMSAGFFAPIQFN